MANKIYPIYKQALLDGLSDIDINNGVVKAMLIDTANYTYSDAHDFLNDVSGTAIIATSAALSSKTVTNGTFDAADFAFSAVTGASCEALILFIDTGVSSTSRLVAYYDTGVTGFPVTPNGGDINVTVNASGFFAL